MLYEWGGKSKDGMDEFKSKRPGWEIPIHSLLVKHCVAAVFHGHNHFFAYQDLDGASSTRWFHNRDTPASIASETPKSTAISGEHFSLRPVTSV